MATYQPITPMFTLILADNTLSVQIPDGIVAQGFQYMVVDNLGTAAGSGTHIALSGPINGSTSGTSISTAYGSALLTWDGNTFIQK